MGLEAATYINQLVQTNPTSIDPKGQGDDHFRLIKSVLKNTFPNITGAVTMTQAQLNKVGDNTLYCFPGMIVMWSGTVASIPTGWKLCNGSGTISTGGAVPNLLNRFIVGAGNTYNPGATGGAASHTHTITVNNHTLTLDQIPNHGHQPSDAVYVTRTSAGGGISDGFGGGLATRNEVKVGGGQGHNHSASSSSVSNLPPYYALAFIIKN